MATILITGGSGLIGRALTQALQAEGHTVRWLSRRGRNEGNVEVFTWDLEEAQVDERALVGVDHIVHLSGEGIADKRWTTSRLEALSLSRGGGARILYSAADRTGIWPKSFISASGSGYYGAHTSDHLFTEDDPPATDTIGKLTVDWEAGARVWSKHCRVVMLRTPFVVARGSAGVKKMARAVRWGVGSALGSGKQWMPWIHLSDLVRAYQLAVNDTRLSGAYNIAAPEQPNNEAFLRTMASVLHRPFFMPNVPAFVLKLLLGELSTIVLEGSRMSTERLTALGFRPRIAELRGALEEALRS